MNEQERRIKELEAQNAQMGEVIGQMAHDHAEQGREIARLERENAEVRDLVRDMWHDGMCYCDEFVAAQGQYHCAECEYGYHERMRKLGIEVE